MRVDFVITELNVGGAERCLTELALGLKARGDEIRVFSLATLPRDHQGVLVQRLHAGGIHVSSAGADSATRTHRAYRQLCRWFAESKPDVAHTFLHHANVLGGFAARAAGVPARIAGIRVAEPRPLRCWIERSALKRVHRVACVSRGVERFAVEFLGCDSGKTIVIPNGVDVDRFASAEAFRWSRIGWPDDAQVSLFVGRFHPQKGIENLQQQVDCLATSNSPRRLLMVGEGPLRGELVDWAKRIGNDRIQLLPWQSDVAPLIRACRLLVLPSHYEGMPNVVLEAMAAGRPVVCSRVEGSDELLADTIVQQSFPVGDVSAMKNLAEQFLSDEALCNEIGIINQTRAREHFSLSAMVSAYRDLYCSLL